MKTDTENETNSMSRTKYYLISFAAIVVLGLGMIAGLTMPPTKREINKQRQKVINLMESDRGSDIRSALYYAQEYGFEDLLKDAYVAKGKYDEAYSVSLAVDSYRKAGTAEAMERIRVLEPYIKYEENYYSAEEYYDKYVFIGIRDNELYYCTGIRNINYDIVSRSFVVVACSAFVLQTA